MTEQELSSALMKMAESVTEHRMGIVKEMATLNTQVQTLQSAHSQNAGKLDRVIELELSCPARAGWESLGREMGETKKKISDHRIEVESQLRALRGDQTGQTDVSGIVRQTTQEGKNSVLRGLALRALPYVIFGAIALGAYLASGGDEEATTRALRAVTDAVASINNKLEVVERKVDGATSVPAQPPESRSE